MKFLMRIVEYRCEKTQDVRYNAEATLHDGKVLYTGKSYEKSYAHAKNAHNLMIKRLKAHDPSLLKRNLPSESCFE